MQTPIMRTIPEAAAELKRMDKNTAVTLCALRRMVKTGALPSVSVASRRLVNMEQLFELLGGKAASQNSEPEATDARSAAGGRA